ncbi:hypothetical protein CBM2606_A10119 [Cupriavidus taiwanensis]|uniref:hypothetical protein n=1 Tax=Cupriavidus taiwanensis TaxID=164546 RepID=UPI000E155106|nr:hypothetical protein [Cupriavidus taiwanensis]SPA36215.1 hypothetical protein CBM2606_A10119 [Cupriavidus taiwanensis]
MNDKHSASYEASTLLEAFLTANPQPAPEQWKALTLANPKLAAQIADAELMLSIDAEDAGAELPFEAELFNATRSAMLNAVETNTAPIEAARVALKQCRGPAARKYARQIGLGEHVDLFNQMVSGETSAPYVLLKRLAAQLQVRLAAMAEVFSLNFQNQPAQSFKADGKPSKSRKPVSWEEAVKAAGINGQEAARLLHLERELD